MSTTKRRLSWTITADECSQSTPPCTANPNNANTTLAIHSGKCDFGPTCCYEPVIGLPFQIYEKQMI